MTQPISKWHWSVWLRGLLAALVSGASSGVAAMLAIPEAVNTAHPAIIAKVTAIGAVVGIAGYLKQSPIPSEDPDPAP